MGIILSKERVIDTILTQQGREQLSQGKLKASYVSFTDANAIYNSDTIVSGGLQAINRFVFEAASLPQDQVTLTADDTGLLVMAATSGSERFKLTGGHILSSSNGSSYLPVTGALFNSMVEGILDTSISNFQNLFLLKSPDPVDGNKQKQFLIGPTSTEFSITPTNPVPEGGMKKVNVNNIESLFHDQKLSHISNFKFLPPVNSAKEAGTPTSTPLGTYVNLNQNPILDFSQVEEMVASMEAKGYSTTINFIETSAQNNLFCQFFEVSNGQMLKLDVIDFGEFPTSNGAKQVFFAGKVFEDDYGNHTFVNMFTIVFFNQ